MAIRMWTKCLWNGRGFWGQESSEWYLSHSACDPQSSLFKARLQCLKKYPGSFDLGNVHSHLWGEFHLQRVKGLGKSNLMDSLNFFLFIII